MILLILYVLNNLIMEEKYFDYNLGFICIVFTVIYIFISASATTLSYYSVYYAPVSSFAVSLVCTSVLLYVSQRTFLKTFYPGNANAVEVIGIMTAGFGMAILPGIHLLLKQKKSH